MEHPFFTTTTTRAEALRWLTIAEKLLSARDLMGSKSFATRARDSDPTLSPADLILAVVDTLLAGDRRIGNNHPDWYAILRMTPQQGRDSELIASQYRNIVNHLNPQKNRFPFAEEALRLVVEAWSVLGNPSRKSMYDKELAFYLQPQQQPDPFSNPNPIPQMHQNFIFFGGSSSGGVAHPIQPQGAVHFSQVHGDPRVDPAVAGPGPVRGPQNFMNLTSGTNLGFGDASGSKVSHEPVNKQTPENYSGFGGNVEQDYSGVGEKTGDDVNVSENNVGDEEDLELEGLAGENEDGSTSFWTACPYCYYMYEYPGVYVDCTLRCHNCKKASQAVVIPSPPPPPPPTAYFCCWGFLPLGFSMENWDKIRGAAASWTPFSPMFAFPREKNVAKKAGRKSTGPRIYVDDDDEVFVEISESSGSDAEKQKKKAKIVKGKGGSGSGRKAQVDKGKNVSVPPNGVETTAGDSRAAVNARKQPGRTAKNFEKLDLNVEFSNETEEPAPMTNQGKGATRGEDDNIEGIGFFEGLDEFLSSLPILNVVGDDKVVKAA